MGVVCTHPVSLSETLAGVLSRFRGIFSQERVFLRAFELVFAAGLTFARKTMTQMRTFLGLAQEDWSRDYRLLSQGRFDSKAAAAITLRLTLEHVPADRPYCAVVDVTYVGRSSLRMPGTCWTRGHRTARWSPGLERAQRFENLCWLTPVENGYCRAIPLMWEHAPTPRAVPSMDEPLKEWEAGLRSIQWSRNELNAAGRAMQILFFAADGSYDVNGIWKGLPATNTVLITRCAKNRKLLALAAPPLPGARKTRRKYGERAPTPEAMRKDRQDWQRMSLEVRGRKIRMICKAVGPYLVEGAPETPLYLLLVRGYHRSGTKRTRRDPCQYLVNAVNVGGEWCLPMPLIDLLGATWRRWEIEVCHREIKTGFGLGEMQCWSKGGSTDSVEFMAWAYSSLVLAGYKTWNGVLAMPTCRLPRWRKRCGRWSINTLLQALREEVWRLGDYKPVYTALPNKPANNGKLSALLVNAALGSARG